MVKNAHEDDSTTPRAGLGDVYATAGVLSILVVSVHLQHSGSSHGWPWPLQVLTWVVFLGLRADPLQRRMGRGSLTRGNGWRTALGCVSGAAVASGAGLPELTAAFCAVVIAVHLQWGHHRALRVGGVMTVGLVLLADAAVHLGVVDAFTGTSSTVLSLAVAGLGLPVVGNLAVLAAGQERTQLALLDEQRQREDLLRRTAERNPLTGLLDRRALDAALDLAASQAGPGRAAGVLCCDVDRSKAVNDEHGHAAGDAVLVQVAERLLSTTRDGTPVGRVGGDEFVVVLEGLADPAHAEAVAGRLRAALAAPFVVDGVDVGAGVSLGVSTASEPNTARSLLAGADAGTYAAEEARARVAPAGHGPASTSAVTANG